MISPKLRNWIIGVVTAVWATNFIASVISPLDYDSDPILSTVFMGVVGGAFALGRKKNGKNGNGEEAPK